MLKNDCLCGHAKEYHHDDECLCYPCTCNDYVECRGENGHIEINVDINTPEGWFNQTYKFNINDLWNSIYMKLHREFIKVDYPDWLEYQIRTIYHITE